MGKNRKNRLSSADTHNYGIDLLRCLSMFMILVLHIFNQGGVITAVQKTSQNGWNYYLCWGVRFACLGAVNIYGMISGYVMLNSSFKPRRLFSLWLQVVFIAVTICVLTQIFFPGRMLKEYWLKSALPVSQRLYWYFTCYTGVFLLSPVINRGIRALTDKQATGLLLSCIVLFCVVATIGYANYGDAFYLVGGYSVLWLLVLYVIGACLKKTDLLTCTKTWKLLLVMLICLGVSCVWYFCKLPAFMGESKEVALKFINPFMLAFDICLFVLLARAEFRSTILKKILCFVAPLTFSVYLLHLHPVVWTYLKNSFLFVAKFPAWAQLPFVLGVAIAIFAVGILLDWLRSLLFRLLHVEKFCAWAEKVLRKCAEKISRYLLKRT